MVDPRAEDLARAVAVARVVAHVQEEIEAALVAFPRPFASAHEGFAILKEEVDELWEDVRMPNKGDQTHRKDCMRKEAIQVAAMAMRFILEVCDA